MKRRPGSVSIAALSAVLLSLAGCGGDGSRSLADGLGGGAWDGSGILVIEGARVFTSPLTDPLEDAVVVVAGGRIEAVGARGDFRIPQGARRINGSGGSLLAGFWDVHVQIPPEILDAAADPTVFADEIEALLAEVFTRLGFTFVLDPVTPLGRVQPLLERIRNEGIPSPAILATGGVPVADLQIGVGANLAEAGDPALDALLDRVLRDAGTLVPTLSRLAPAPDLSDADLEGALAELRRVQLAVAAYTARGGRVAFGSGLGFGAVADPLFEMDLWQEGGIPFPVLLEGLTTEPARVFGNDDRGEVEPGLVADLVLLDGDPRSDLGAFERVRWVLRAGVPIYGEVR